MKYYKFTVVDDRNVENVIFEMTPLHGDSDLFVSRDILFPNQTTYEKKSSRFGSLVDHISYSKTDNGALA